MHFHATGITGKINPMPWPATHILIAEKVFEPCFSHLDKSAFIIGTCFPGIRYLAKIERKQTHFNHLSLDEIQSQPAFHAGLHFHSLTDAAWNAYVHQHRERLFSEIPHNAAMFHTIKVLQDRYLYHKFMGWEQLTDYFGRVLPEEREFGLPEVILQQWHMALANYLGKPPNFDDLEMLEATLPKELVQEIRGYYQAYLTNPILEVLMVEFYNAAEQLLMDTVPSK